MKDQGKKFGSSSQYIIIGVSVILVFFLGRLS